MDCLVFITNLEFCIRFDFLLLSREKARYMHFYCTRNFQFYFIKVRNEGKDIFIFNGLGNTYKISKTKR